MAPVNNRWISLKRANYCLCLAAVLTCVTIALAQSAKPVPAAQLCVDRVVLKSGKTIRGAILRQEPNGPLTMAAAREWLRQANPDLLARITQNEQAIQRQAWEQVRDRLKMELPAAAESSRLSFFLSRELERVEKLLAAANPPEPPQFVWVELAKGEYSSVTRAAADRQRVALWAWDKRVAGVETRDAADLSRELKAQGVDASQPPPELSDRLPIRLQDDREWSARMALVTYAMGEPLDFQGTGDLLVRANSERGAKDMGPLIAKILKSQVEALTKDLANEGRPPPVNSTANNDWLKSAFPEAERGNARAFRATRVQMNLDRRQVAVQTALVARLDKGTWEPIWVNQQSEEAKPRAEIEARIANDPQVKAALDLIKNLGLGAEDRIQQAIRFGAATMAAQQAADSRFLEFRDRHLKQLTGPPIWWSAP